MITVANISKSFGRFRAIHDLSFEIKPGEIVGLLGPNGAGKTTTMRMLTGFMTPDSGSITIDNMDVINNPLQVQKSIGYLPENNPLYKDMLVSDLLNYSAGLKGLSENQARQGIDFAVKNVSIQDVYFRPISELSKGYKQRVGIAMALLHQPQILIMDEPSEGLDPNQRTDIRSLIRNLAKDHTIIVSTHVMQEVEAVCSRMIIINKGVLVADGTPKQLSAKAGGGMRLQVQISGKDVVNKLQKMKNITNILKNGIKNNVYDLVLTPQKGVMLQPELLRTAVKNNWVIWKMMPEEKQLEDVFHMLTSVS